MNAAQTTATLPDQVREVEIGDVRRRAKRPRRFQKAFSVYMGAKDYEELAARAAAQNHSFSRYARQRLLRSHQSALPIAVQQQILDSVAIALAATRKLALEFEVGSAATAELENICVALSTIRSLARQIRPRQPDTPPTKHLKKANT